MAIQFDKFAAKGHEFIKVLAIELGHPEDKGRAGRVLRSVLHAFRKHLTPEESLQMVSQLPMFLKALYVDGWRLSESPTRINHLEDFIQEVKRIDGRTANNDFGTDEETEQAIKTVFSCLKNYVSEGEIDDVRAQLPEELKPLI